MIGRGAIHYFAVAALALSHCPAWAEGSVHLTPSSKWNVDYADDSCRLARQFGTGEQTSWLIFERFEPSDFFRLSVAGELFRYVRADREATVRFGPAEGDQTAFFMEGEMGQTPTLVFSTGLRIAPITEQEEEALEKLKGSAEVYSFEPAPIGPERERTATSLSIDVSGAPEIVFETGSLGEPFAALRKCMNELLTHWGIDVERHASLTKKAVPIESPGNWLRSSDYPRSLLRKGAQGIVHFRLSVDGEGNVGDCHIQRSTRPEGFDDAVCDALMRRARFEPALDAQGNPVASYFIGSVRFIMA